MIERNDVRPVLDDKCIRLFRKDGYDKIITGSPRSIYKRTMVVFIILLCGIIATALMTVFMNICAVGSRRNLYTIKILTQMLATLNAKVPSVDVGSFRFVAVAVHYAIGALFALVYYMLRTSNGYIGFTSPAEPWIIGFIYGMTGVSGWIVFIRIHPSPPQTVPWLLYLCCVFLGHLVFTFAMIFSFALLWV